ncbi:hypothetical protein TNCV_492621 [Trichonephila clavipes]|nr:hypothetical protein TNCV_492621 [Trichonephila clavipes]
MRRRRCMTTYFFRLWTSFFEQITANRFPQYVKSPFPASSAPQTTGKGQRIASHQINPMIAIVERWSVAGQVYVVEGKKYHFNVSNVKFKRQIYSFISCQVIYSQFGLAIHQNDHQVRRRFVEWARNEIAFVPDFHKRILFSDEAHFWLNGYVNKENGRIWREANPQAYVETPLHPEKLTVWCALWAGGILLQKQ